MCKIFIFEGPDYSGKTTLISNLYKHFKSTGKRVAMLKEPDGEIRKMLLDKNGNLPFAARRFLYAADHMETLDTIYGIKNKYDFIFIDRTAVISDMIYSEFESNNKELSMKMSNTLKSQFKIIDNLQYDDYFRKNSTLVLLNLSKQELMARMSARAINNNDIFDIKSNDFKIKIWEKYKNLIEDVRKDYLIDILFMFKRVCIAEVDDNLVNNVIRLIEGEE